jgi:branched-chain amino acid aminotransferase
MSVVWFNSAFVEGTLPIDPADRGLLLGDGVFETIAVNHHRAIWLDEHLARMASAAKELGIGFNEIAVRDGVTAVLERSATHFEVLRVTLTRGITERGLAAKSDVSSVLISLNAFDPAKQPQSLRLAVSKIRRNETAPSSRLKTLSYIDGIAAAREASGVADDVLMLNTKGHVASSTVGNLFLLRGSELFTPQLDQGVLPGITRHHILQLSGWQKRETIINIEDVFAADAAFLSNSLRLVTPVTMLDGRPLGARSVEDIKTRLETLTRRN